MLGLRPTLPRQRGRARRRLRAGSLGSPLNPAALLLSLSLLCGCTPGWGWSSDTVSIHCKDGEKPAIFSYSVAEQGIQFPGMPVMLQRNIPDWVQQLWVEEDRFLVIWAARALHCDNFDASGRLRSGHCEGHRVVTGHAMMKYDHGRMRYWPVKGSRQLIAQDVNFEPSGQPTNNIAGCVRQLGFRQQAFANLRYFWVEIQRQ